MANSYKPVDYIRFMVGNESNRANKQIDLFNTKLNEIAEATIRKGSKLSNDELKDIIGSSNWSWYYNDAFDDAYDTFVSDNYNALFSSEVQDAYNASQMKSSIGALQNAFSGLEPKALTQNLNAAGLNTDYQTYLDALNAVSEQQYKTAMNELSIAENEMYRAIGLSQRQMERDIAKRRQQALKSGMSTAQLAAQEQQNILAAQTGAAQIAQQYADQRYSTINQFAGVNAQNYADTLANQIQYTQNLNQFNAQQSANWSAALAEAFPQYYAADQYKQQ